MATKPRYGKSWVSRGRILCWEYRASRRRLVQLRTGKGAKVIGPWEFNPHSKTWSASTRKWR